MKFYTGVGSRQTPSDALVQFAGIFVTHVPGWVNLRRDFFRCRRRVLRPQDDFVDRVLDTTFESGVRALGSTGTKYITKTFQDHCVSGALHGRNVQLVLGEDLLVPSDFVVAWTFDGVEKGGTRTPLVLAQQRGIATFNLANPEQHDRFKAFLLTLRQTRH